MNDRAENNAPVKVSEVTRSFNQWEVLSEIPFDQSYIDQLAPILLKEPRDSHGGPLSGRSRVERVVIDEIGPVIVKPYTRGGLLQRFISRGYIRYGEPRSSHEYRFILKAREAGCQVPTPVAALWTRGMFYHAWLVTKEISHLDTLARLSMRDESLARDMTEILVADIRKLVNNRIFHVDLHPGNVLISKENIPVILDFDKAYISQDSPDKLLDQYLRRWRRAVIKHNLPEVLTEMMCLGLRSYRNQ